MSKEWKTLWFDGSLNNPTLRKLNKLTIEGWEVEYVIPGHALNSAASEDGKVFLSREREKGEIEEEKLEEVRKEALKRIERQKNIRKKKDLVF